MPPWASTELLIVNIEWSKAVAVGILIIVTRGIDQSFQRTGRYIAFEEWTKLVDSDLSLRIRAEPDVAVNPATGARIVTQAGEADSEVEIGGEWMPFLRYRRGELRIGFTEALLNPRDPVRYKIAAVAKALDALITHDAGDELLWW